MIRWILTFTFLFSAYSYSQNVSGNVTDFHFSPPLADVSVTLKDNQSNQILGTDSTDETGSYNIDYVLSVNKPYSLPDDFSLSNPYPNPFNPQTSIEFSSPRQNRFSVRIFSVTGELVYVKNFEMDAGYHLFTVSGLGAAGVYLFNISSEDFTATQKLLLLDGGSGLINVNLKNNNRILSKFIIDELKLEFRKNGYENKDSVFNWQMNLIVNAQLNQIPKPDTIHFFTDQNMIPTNTPANNAVLSGYLTGLTSSQGEFETDFVVQYIMNPLDSLDKKYTPTEITVNVSRANTLGDSETFVINGSDISWLNDLQQTLINKNGSLTGNVDDELGFNLENVLVKHYDDGNGTFFGQDNTNASGDYQINFSYQGYENDPSDEFSPVQQTRTEFSKAGYIDTLIVKDFVANDVINMVMREVQQEPYIVDFSAELRKTFKGEMITDLDTIWVDWKNGEVEPLMPVNGVLNVYKELETVSADTTAEIFHTRPDKYLNWMIGHRVNPERGDWMFQNPSYQEKCVVPLNDVNAEGNIEIYMIPKWANYGPNNDIPMDMESTTLQGFFSRNAAYVSGFRPSPAGWDTTDVLQFTFNLSTNDPIDPFHVNRARNEIQRFLNALNWQHKNLLVYRFTEIDSVNDPFLQYIINGPRDLDNFTFSTFYSGPAGNVVSIALDGTYRIKYSHSDYNINNNNFIIQEELFSSVTNTVGEMATYLQDSNLNYTDLAENLIGICYILKPGTQYL